MALRPDRRKTLASETYRLIVEAADAVAHLRSFVGSDPPTHESAWLEFKPYPYEKPDETIKEIWSKTLCAFANTQGGVLIWGIGTSKKGKYDAADSIQLVDDPHRLRDRLMQLHHNATDPPIQGILVKSIPDPSVPGKGFVVCYVPQGIDVPYRAEMCGRQYYVRMGDNSDVPAPITLRRLFYPQSRARLEISVLLEVLRPPSREYIDCTLRHTATLVNRGTASAAEVFIKISDAINWPRGTSFGIHPGEDWLRVSGSPNFGCFLSKFPIHPGFPTQFASSEEWFPPERDASGDVVRPVFEPFVIEFHVYARDMDYRHLVVEFRPEDLADDRCEKTCEPVEEDVTPDLPTI